MKPSTIFNYIKRTVVAYVICITEFICIPVSNATVSRKETIPKEYLLMYVAPAAIAAVVFALTYGLAAATTNSFHMKQPVDYVDPFIGTGGHGHTYPGATVPFGMVQLSPDIGKRGWDYCSGYHYSDSMLVGFSHTHLSGTGCADLGDILFQPMIGIPAPDTLMHFRFDKIIHLVPSIKGVSFVDMKVYCESATPGYYRVELPQNHITVELTATERCGFHRYTFPKSDSAYIVIDAGYGQDDSPLESTVKVTGANSIVGSRRSSGWAWTQQVYFAAEFSTPFASTKMVRENQWVDNPYETSGKTAKAVLRFKTEKDDSILVRVGISAVSIEGALKNLHAEIPRWNFDSTRIIARTKWNDELSKIKVEGTNIDNKQTFYTALYHTMCAPTLFHDVDFQYRGGDGKNHLATNYHNYSTFSLWDTYRAEHPLFTIMHPARVVDMYFSMLGFQSEYGYLPVWPLAGWETQCMIGYHSVPVIADAFLKGLPFIDGKRALDAMKVSAFANHKGLEYYNMAQPDSIEKKLAQLHENDINSGFDYKSLRLDKHRVLSGYAKTISGEPIDYHSSYPYVTKALLVRATTGDMKIEWQTEALPQSNDDSMVTFMWLAGRSVNKGWHRFDLLVNGEKWFTFNTGRDRNDKNWTVTNTNGSSLTFVPTLKDVYDDQFGNMFLQVPTALLKKGQPLNLTIVGEKGDSYDWYMTFEYQNQPGMKFETDYALAVDKGVKQQFVRVMVEHLEAPAYANISVDGNPTLKSWLNPGVNLFDLPFAVVNSVKNIRVSVFTNSLMESNYTIKPFKTLEYVPADRERESVSKTLEYAYDDWCIAQVAKKINDTADYNLFTNRSGYYRNLYDSTTGFMRGRNFDGSWVSPFNPRYSTELQPQYTEGNAWQWTWSVQHDIPGLIKLMGGEAKFEQKLDSLFNQSSDLSGTGATADVSGLIGMYAHGNEPSHHIAYLYDNIGKAWKTQKLVRQIMNDFYTNKTDGLCGNEDCGQMSAWYVFSAMGFYPANPVGGFYQIGSPLFDKVTITLGNKKEFIIEAVDNSDRNKYIQSAKLNGMPFEGSLRHEQILRGGKLVFKMGPTPNPKWGMIAD